MADGVPITPGSGVTVTADELTNATSQLAAASQAQYVKLMDGVEGSATKAKVTAAGGGNTPINVALALTMTPSVSRVVGRKPTLALTLTPTVSRVIDRKLPLALTLATSVRRVVERKLSLALSLPVTVLRVVDRRRPLRPLLDGARLWRGHLLHHRHQPGVI